MNVTVLLNSNKEEVINYIKRHIRTIGYISHDSNPFEDYSHLDYIADVIFKEAVIRVITEFRKEVSLLVNNINIDEEYREVLNNKLLLKAIEITDKLFIEFYMKK